MANQNEQGMGILDRSLSEAPAVFVTAFRNGTGGHRVEVLSDRIVTRDRRGGTSQLRFAEIESALAFETDASPPTFGIHVVRRDNPHDVRYVFGDDATRRAFLRAVDRRLRTGTA